MKEYSVTLKCNEEQLLGIIHHPDNVKDVAVLVIVGGPQYRVGSHRQFVQLSRALASHNIASMRFDYTGMGDSEGKKKNFDSICADIKAACDLLCKQTNCNKVVIWGLCDAASAAMIYAEKDNRVVGLILLNPWLESDAAKGKAMLKHYYLKRLFSIFFWKKLLTGKVNVSGSVSDAKGFVKASVSVEERMADNYQTRMQKGLASFNGSICLILSGVDLTAKEFEQQALGNQSWSVLQSKKSSLYRLDKADHTFSSAEYKRRVEFISIEFVSGLMGKRN